MSAASVNADVVLAALASMRAALNDRSSTPSVRISIARTRLDRLASAVENQAVDVPDLEGATLPPIEGHIVGGAGEFAAVWNTLDVEKREGWVRNLGEAAAEAQRCLMQNHKGLVEQNRVAFMSSAELGSWAEAMRRFADTWVSRESNGGTIYSLIVMEGEGEHRHEVEHAVTVRDLRRAAGIAQRLAHDNVDHAVMVEVDEWADLEGGSFEVIAIDGRVLIDYEMIAAMLEAAGMRKQ